MRHVRFVLALASILVLPGWTPAMADEAQKTEPAPKLERCEAPTGSRISPERDSKGECPKSASPGKTYTRDDLQSTGEINVGDALSRLDPSISRSGR